MLAIHFPQIDPVILHIAGPISIRWYGIAYIAGILLGILLLMQLSKRDKYITFSRQILDDLVFYSAFGIVIGGRLGHIVFYDLHAYIADPIAILQIWQGGMSFHGGIIGLTLAIYLLCAKHKLDFLHFTDLMSCTAPIGLFFGRIANFINAELYGRQTDVSWAMIFPEAGGVPRHPSQLYEAGLEGITLFIIMMLLFYKTQSIMKKGLLSGIFLILYSTFRMISEVYREPEIDLSFALNYITMGQLLSMPLILLGVYLIRRSFTA